MERDRIRAQLCHIAEHQPTAAWLSRQVFDRRAHGRRVRVIAVVNESRVPASGDHLQATAHPPARRQARRDVIQSGAQGVGGRRCGQRVDHIVPAQQRQLDWAAGLAQAQRKAGNTAVDRHGPRHRAECRPAQAEA